MDCWIVEFAARLRTGAEAERATIAGKLADIGNEAALIILISALPQEKSAYVRRKIISLLGVKKTALVVTLAAAFLSSDAANVRGMAREILVALGDVAMDELTHLMLNDSRDIRKQAVDILAEIPGESSFELLVEGLADADVIVAAGCADALGRRGDKRATAPLSMCLNTFPATWVGFSIIQALNALGDTENISVMNEYIAGSKTAGERTVLVGAWSEAVGRACRVDALPVAWELYGEGILSNEEILRMISSIQSCHPAMDLNHPSLEALLSTSLEKGHGEMLLNAASLAARYAPKAFCAALPYMGERIAIDEKYARSDALETMAKVVLSAGLGPTDLGALLTVGDELSTSLAIAALEGCSLALPLAELAAAYKKAGPENAARILRLAARSGYEALDLYYEVLEGESDEEILQGAMDGAGRLSGECATSFFCRALLHTLPTVRKAAMEALIQKASPRVGKTLVGQLTASCAYAWPEILATLSVFKLSDLALYWQQAVKIEDDEIRVRLAAALDFIVDENLYLSVAKTLVNDPDADVRRMTILSLSRRSGEKVWELLSYLYENDPEKRHRYHILACREICRHPQGFKWLKENLGEQDALLQTAAIRGLCALGAAGLHALDEAVGSRPNDARLREMVESL